MTHSPGTDAPPSLADVDHGLVQSLTGVRTESGSTLLELVDRGTVLLVFLRHFGCSYCRQAISDVAELAPALEAKKVQPVFVHLGTPERARPYFEYYGLGAVERISDPEGKLYGAGCFSLPRTHPLSHFFVGKVVKGWLMAVYASTASDYFGKTATRCPECSCCVPGRSSARSASRPLQTSRTISA